MNLDTAIDTLSAATWRSMLFVPAHITKFVRTAHSRGADAYVLDLEDSVPLSMKEAARAVLAAAVRQVSASGAAALVRVNEWPHGQALDLEAAVVAGAAAVVLPKVGDASSVLEAADVLDRVETRAGTTHGTVKLIALIEDVRALPRLDEIAQASPRLVAMTLRSEDFSASAGMEPIRDTLIGPSQQVQFACRRAGLVPFGYPASIAEFADVDDLRSHVVLARRMGFVGALCIHLSQVPILNEGFAPTGDEVEWAAALIDAFEAASTSGQAALRFRGKMVDRPVVSRARELLVRASRIKRQEIP